MAIQTGYSGWFEADWPKQQATVVKIPSLNHPFGLF
jgi:hypothetical protein